MHLTPAERGSEGLHSSKLTAEAGSHNQNRACLLRAFSMVRNWIDCIELEGATPDRVQVRANHLLVSFG